MLMCGLYLLVGLNNALCIVKVDTQKVSGYRETMDGVDCIDLDFSL